MCGIVGAVCNNTEKNVEFIKELYTQSQIRGKHATGISWVNEYNTVQTMSSSEPAKTFVKCFIDFPEKITMIGHVRYSTSDLKYNQPLQQNGVAMVHNGVITQEDPTKWENDFGYCDFETKNDSEILLKSIIEGESHFHKFPEASIACAYIKSPDSGVSFSRNGTRPIWYIETDFGLFLASTKDILLRALGVCGLEATPKKVTAGCTYNFSHENGLFDPECAIDIPDSQIYNSTSYAHYKPAQPKDHKLPKIDWRTNRPLYLEEYFWWSLNTYDVDPSMYMMNYVFGRMELNTEQRYWISWLYGVTYNLPTAWIIANEFPDFENVDLERLTQWEIENKSRLRYQTDTKFNRSNLATMFKSYKEAIGEGTQAEWFDSRSNGTPAENFEVIYADVIKHFNRFGRYMTWFYLQTLKETCNLQVEPQSLLLEDQSAHTQRQAIAYAVGDDEIAELKLKHHKLPKEKVSEYSTWSNKFLIEFNKKYPHLRADHFLFETVLCAWKKTFRETKGRYLGYYLDRQYEDIKKAEDLNWIGIDWQLLYQARDEMLIKSTNRQTGVVKSEMLPFIRNGEFTNFGRILPSNNSQDSIDEWL